MDYFRKPLLLTLCSQHVVIIQRCYILEKLQMCQCIQNFNLEKPKGREHFEGLGVDGRIILKWK
jgi:hypothetical protein